MVHFDAVELNEHCSRKFSDGKDIGVPPGSV